MLQELLVMILFYLGLKNYTPKTKKTKLESETDKLKKQLDEQLKQRIEVERELRAELEDKDRRRVTDVMEPPERRLPRRYVAPKRIQRHFNESTQGLPENFQYVGNLVRETDGKILPLFGREDHPRSDYWEYYIVFNENDNFGIKIPITGNKPIRELEEDAQLNVPYFKGDKFTYKPFDYQTLRYNPYDY